MAFIRLNDLRLIEEYCVKPNNEKCPIGEICYTDEFQCRYWKQVFENPVSNNFVVRQGNSWKAGNNDR